jgi:hypothetical protein
MGVVAICMQFWRWSFLGLWEPRIRNFGKSWEKRVGGNLGEESRQ